MRRTWITLLGACLLTFTAQGAIQYPPLQGPAELIVMPDTNGHADFNTAIRNAHTSIIMEMYHLTDMEAINSLIEARKNGVQVQIILDRSSFKDAAHVHKYLDGLKNAGAEVRESSKAFSLTHSKTMIIDGKTAFVTSINLTNTADDTRDLGIITLDRGVIDEITAVFQADWKNAETNGDVTPPLSDGNLTWSPDNSKEKLKALIDSADHTIVSTVENIGYQDIDDAFAAAVKRGVDVELIIPECNEGDTMRNYQYVPALLQAGVKVRVMPHPANMETPYIHSKMILVDDESIYIGSVNFSFNSIEKARELGILLTDVGIAKQVRDVFDSDWAKSQAPTSNPNPHMCPAWVPNLGSSGDDKTSATAPPSKKAFKRKHAHNSELI